jgi:hypothetical protein
MKMKKCKHCNALYVPSPFNHKQAYCPFPECQRESNRASSQKYRDKNKNNDGYKETNKMHVRNYRAKNPDYDKKYRKKASDTGALSDLALSEIKGEISALSDLASLQSTIMQGIISYGADALSDTIGDAIKVYYIRGSELSKDSFQPLILENMHAKATNHPKSSSKSP